MIILLGTLVCISALIVAKEWQTTDLLDYVKQLRSEDIAERQAAAGVILQRKEEALTRADVVAGIEDIVREFGRNEERKGTAKTAIDLLGDFQSSRSVPLLVEHLTLRVFYKETKRPQRKEDLFPSVGALVKIGQSSLDPVLSRAEGTDDEDVTRCAAYVVKGVLKGDARTLIEDRLAHQPDTNVRKRLSAVQQYIKN